MALARHVWRRTRGRPPGGIGRLSCQEEQHDHCHEKTHRSDQQQDCPDCGSLRMWWSGSSLIRLRGWVSSHAIGSLMVFVPRRSFRHPWPFSIQLIGDVRCGGLGRALAAAPLPHFEPTRGRERRPASLGPVLIVHSFGRAVPHGPCGEGRQHQKGQGCGGQ